MVCVPFFLSLERKPRSGNEWNAWEGKTASFEFNVRLRRNVLRSNVGLRHHIYVWRWFLWIPHLVEFRLLSI